MTDIERCIAEQAEARDAAVAGERGAILGVSDWALEEVLLRLEIQNKPRKTCLTQREPGVLLSHANHN